ncbi:MAG TPA: MarR family transcriptional regulator [Nitrospira sp.]|nr:MarR family transcriptional regulator [Nitrospira sp.]
MAGNSPTHLSGESTGEPDREAEGREAVPQFSLPIFNAGTEVLVRHIKEARFLRAEFFDPELFGEPAWDILLDLYAAALTQRRISTNALGVSSGVPGTTMIRWLRTLEAKGLVRRHPDPVDLRRVFVALTHDGQRSMDAMFDALWKRTAALQLRR